MRRLFLTEPPVSALRHVRALRTRYGAAMLRLDGYDAGNRVLRFLYFFNIVSFEALKIYKRSFVCRIFFSIFVTCVEWMSATGGPCGPEVCRVQPCV